MTKPWKPDGVPFAWQPKAALRRIRECLDHDGTVLSGIAVFVALTELASDEGSTTFTTTQGFIGMRCGVERHTVGKRLVDLRDLGLVTFETPKLKAPITITLSAVGTSSANVGTSSASVGNQPENGTITTSKENPKKGKELTSSPNGSEAEVLYETYPRHVGRGQALKAIRAALKKADFATLKTAVRRYAASRNGQDSKFTPHPATWFNAERWLDEPEEAHPSEEKSKVLTADFPTL